jgi:lysophospholipid acyltransferase (LPLAT)-like uncharacterized protein
LAVGRTAVRLLGRSLRFEELGREHVAPLWVADSPVIYATWHRSILMLPYFYGRLRRLHVLASRSRDGEVVSRFVTGFGLGVVRGSTSRGGATALRGLARLLREKRAEVVVVPDGPRGPREVAQAGPVLLARLSGAPIVPVGVGASRATVLGTWDAFVIPHPFARFAVVFGPPLRVPPDVDRGGLEAARRRLQTALAGVTEAAERRAGAPRVPGL